MLLTLQILLLLLMTYWAERIVAKVLRRFGHLASFDSPGCKDTTATTAASSLGEVVLELAVIDGSSLTASKVHLIRWAL